MSRRHWLTMAIVCSPMLFSPEAARAQQTVNLSLGYFTVRGQDARVAGDVLNASRNFWTFDVNDFNGGSIGGEWLVPVGRYIEAGAGVSFTRRTVPSYYTRFFNEDRSNIAQDLRLRMLPAAFTFRLLPLGQDRGFQPYIGGGLDVIAWRYSEIGRAHV